MIIKEDQITVDINFLVPFRDFHLVSRDYEINKLVLENWTLNRIKVPDFKDRDEMKDWNWLSRAVGNPTEQVLTVMTPGIAMIMKARVVRWFR
jgi:hypothetical protein